MKLLVVLGCLGGVLALLGVTSSARADSWDEVVAAARKEGELVAVLGGSASRNYRPVFKHFEDKFGKGQNQKEKESEVGCRRSATNCTGALASDL